MNTSDATVWKCDRCEAQAPAYAYSWSRLAGYDLCPACWQSFLDWMKAPKAMAEALAEMVKGGLLP